MKQRFMARQGDVLIIEITENIPPDAKLIERENGKIILAHGEATGHAHSIDVKTANFFAASANLRFLKTDEAAVLVHQEHAPIQLPAKTIFQIVRQREFTPTRIVNVAD